ncbi:MAG: hypothetical protein J6T46_12850, partial [Victivallales bacterium]|nr:hypothetical protein [Victivallales bacterium]
MTNNSLFAEPPRYPVKENCTRLKGMTRLKGERYGNPALQGGGRVRQDSPSERRHSPERRHLRIVLMP